MKYLTHYIEEAHEALMEECGAFYAFNNQQFNAKKKDGVKYMSLGKGTIVPTDKAKELVDGLAKIMEQGISQDKKDHTPRQIIVRDLNNYESFYTGDIEDTVNCLKGYGEGFTRDDIRKVFKEEIRKEEI